MLRTIAALITLFATLHSAHAGPPAEDPGLPPPERGMAVRLGETIHQATDHASELIRNAMQSLGAPYRRGGTSADVGFDCSGFVRATFERAVGLVLPRRAEEQATATRKIDKEELQPGDLVFFNTLRRAYSHVGIYLGNGQFIHAPRSGARVRVESMNGRYWQKRFNGARRALHAQASPPATRATAVSSWSTSGAVAPSSIRLGGMLAPDAGEAQLPVAAPGIMDSL